MASTCIKQEKGSDGSVLHINVKKEKEDLQEISPTSDDSSHVTDASESWWRDYMVVSEEKPAITENPSGLVPSNQSQVSVLRSFKRHHYASNNGSTSAKDASVSSVALASLVRRNFASPPLQPLEITTSPQNVNNNVNNNKNKARKCNDKCANKNNDINSKNYGSHNLSNVIITTTTTTADKAMKDERENNVFVTEGLVKREEEEDSDYCEEVTIVPSNNDIKESSISRTPIITVVNLSPSRSSVRSLLRGVRIRPVQEALPAVADASAMKFQNDPTKETVKKELDEISAMEVDEPEWVGKSSRATQQIYTSPDDNDEIDLEEEEDDDEVNEEDDEDDEEEDDEEEDEVKENEGDGHNLAVRRRTRQKFEALTMKIRSQLKSSSSTEKPLKMRIASSVVSGTGEYEMYRYQCPFCPFYTNYVVQMKRHRLRHIPDGALNCKRCDYTTKCRQEYKKHLIKHYQAAAGGGDSDETDEEENELDSSADSPEEYNAEPIVDKDLLLFNKPLPSVLPLIPGGPSNIVDNIVATPETKLFEKILDLRCKYCPFFTTYRSIMNQHRTIHQAEGVMYCPQCDLSTWEKEEYKNHLLKHYQRDSFTCEYCGYSTISQYLYMNHRDKHTEKTYCCDDCPYTTGFKKAFKYHCLKHSAEKLLRCKHCPFITKYRHNYRQHMATHTGKGLKFCDFCSFYSAWETNFRRHLARHTIEEEARRLEKQARREAELKYATKTK